MVGVLGSVDPIRNQGSILSNISGNPDGLLR